jgi:glycosyltransferase involved in cell wall biosynthesis
MRRKGLLALFPSGARRELLRSVLDGENLHERFMLYGVDTLILEGITVKTNLDLSYNHLYFRLINSFYKSIAKLTIGSHGELSTALSAIYLRKDYRVILSFSEKCVYPLLFFRFLGFLNTKSIVLISIGLLEKINLLSQRGEKKSLSRLLREVKKISRIMTFSWQEYDVLTNYYKIKNVTFLPYGVDFNVFKPDESLSKKYDVISIGADKHRDFELLIRVARQMSNKRFLLITNPQHQNVLNKIDMPINIEVKIDIPLKEFCSLANSSSVVFLPVKENPYSGATTCLVQAMSLSKPVVVSRVAPISKGYGLVDGKNVIFVEPGNTDAATLAIGSLLIDKKNRKYIAMNARSHVENFLSLDKMINSIKECLYIEFAN